MNEKIPVGGEPQISDIKKKLENYWYHYKIHTIIGAIALITLIICTVQFIGREKHDFRLLYAGPQVIAVQDLVYMEKAVAEVADDFDGNGEVVIAFDDIVMLSPEEREAAAEAGAVFNGEFLNTSMTEYYQQIVGGDAVVCLLSPYMYGIVNEANGFIPLSEIFDTIPDAAYDKCGIVLAKTDFGQYFNGIDDLPEDTVLCVRRLSTMAKFKGEEKTRRAHEANVALFKAMVEFVAPDMEDPNEVCVANIIDRAALEGIATDDALEGFYSDDAYSYCFPSIRSQYITVYYSDGTSENIRDAIGKGKVTIADLDKFDIAYYAQPKANNIDFTAEFYRVDGYGHTDLLMPFADNAAIISGSESGHLIISYFEGTNKLTRFIKDTGKGYQFDMNYYGGQTFNEGIKKYDEAYFKDNALLIVHIEEGSGSIRHAVSSVTLNDYRLEVKIERTVPEVGTCDMADWFAVIEVKKADINGAIAFDATIE